MTKVTMPEPLEIDWPELHSQALGCGVEDRGIHDRYEAAEYGWQDGVDKAIERVPEQIFDAEQMEAYAAAKVREALAWQPIATAPKDGTHVHLFAPELQFVGLYAAVGWCYVALHCPEAPTQPTHWKPLPPPPQHDNE